jgi:hypothetical protein
VAIPRNFISSVPYIKCASYSCLRKAAPKYPAFYVLQK